MAKKATYILAHGATGDVHTAPLLTEGGSRTKFDLSNPDELSQKDLEFLYENNYTNMVIKFEPVAKVEEEKPVTKKKADKADKE